MFLAALLLLVALFQLPPDDSLAKLLQRFRDNDPTAYAEVVAAGKITIDGLVVVMQDADANGIARFQAANALAEIGDKRAVEPLLLAIRDPFFNLRRCAAVALGQLGDERARKPLEALALKDPYVFHDEKTGEDLYLVRRSAKEALELLDGSPASKASGRVKEAEIFLEDAAKPPPTPVRVRIVPLPYPFPGSFKDQNIFNNYQQPTDADVHAGLDIMNPAGTEVKAVADGWVAWVFTNYPDWKTHHFFLVTSEQGGDRGWCYTHVDPDTYTFQVGDKVKRGAVLGKLVDFSVGANDGNDHLHLNYVRFVRSADGKIDIVSLVDPLHFFEHEDTLAPRIQEELRFVKARTLEEFVHAPGEIATVQGKVDVIAGIADNAHAGHGCNWGVPLVTLEIKGRNGPGWRKLVLDQRGEIANAKAGPVLHVKHDDAQRWLAGVAAFPVVHFVIATHTDGDGVLEPADKLQCWDTAEQDAQGKRRFPDGEYEVTVRAWDLSLNKAERTVKVRVKN
ncbi:MAG TPA: HEAT repeat domain-containing protein [Planctomycetota bacterium]|nr:HEAT repeat domain-containing protein [Planctomycetota bacterium]